MNYFCWVLICASVLLSGALARVEYKDWQCGSEDLSRTSAHDTVMANCPLVAAEVNHCCVIHDDCYVRQLGQKRCDQDFCDCNERVLNRTEGHGCQFHALLACLAMPLIAEPAYRSSASYVEPEDLPKHRPEGEGALAGNYETLYAECPKANATISSCAIIFNECRGGKEECAAQLCDCIRDAYRWDHDKDCDKATFNICMIARDEATSPPRDLPRNRPQPALVFLVLASAAVLLTYLLWRMRRRNAYADITNEEK